MTIRTLMIAAEAFPLAKTGGLGDAVAAMARALQKTGVDVTLLLPAYPGTADGLDRLRLLATLSGLPGGTADLISGRCRLSGLPVLLLRNDALYRRDGLYADSEGQPYADNAVRYAALAHAAVRIATGIAGLPVPHLLHAHDWHAALVPMLVRAAGLPCKTVLTVHNLAFQGNFPAHAARELGLPQALCAAATIGTQDQLSFLKSGILYADRITTVSRRYASEILTERFGCGLQDTLRARGADLVAVANGIDDTLWNPARDPKLGAYTYTPSDLSNKRRCKQQLQQLFGLDQNPGSALMAMGSRLTTQKMADVAACALPAMLREHGDLQVAILGRGDKALERALTQVGADFPGRCAVHIGFDETTAHRLHAGADMLLHGSRFEPFGLTPLYAMRYGTIPIGSRVGGMVDTITDPESGHSSYAMRTANGLLFDGDTVEAMAGAVERAIRLWRQPVRWRTMQYNGMTTPLGWEQAATIYAHLYAELTGLAPARPPVPVPVSAAAAGSRPRRTIGNPAPAPLPRGLAAASWRP